MAERYLIDTSAVIKYLNGSFSVEGLNFIDLIVDQESHLCFITKIELLAWDPQNSADLDVYHQFINHSVVFGIDDDIITQAIHIRKVYKLKLPDAIIAATALIYNMTLISDNDKDFLKVKELKYINPKEIG